MPDDERERLATLRLYEILDTADEETFDSLTRLAATICEAPISLVSLVDADRQWFKSRVGLDAIETPREQAFCAHVIMGDDIMVVEDAAEDERFAENPLVTGDPNIRFYAGVPLSVKGDVKLGTLCVIDRKPRKLNQAQIDALNVLRDAVVAHLELRRARMEIQALEHMVSMCAWCRSIRVEEPDGEARWVPPDKYVMNTSPVTHGMCPTCHASIGLPKG